jgi:hypothetical protein
MKGTLPPKYVLPKNVGGGVFIEYSIKTEKVDHVTLFSYQ